MSAVVYEGVVEQGQIRLPPGAQLPENTRVYVLVPGASEKREAHIRSPRLADPTHAARFELEVAEEGKDAGL
ncbi:MAG: hypothetical protein ABSG86_02315 [Thermoguttaceae bacterium]|jgi:hypothetical protein